MQQPLSEALEMETLLWYKFKSSQHIYVSEVLEFRTTITNQQGKPLFDEHHKQGLVFLLNPETKLYNCVPAMKTTLATSC